MGKRPTESDHDITPRPLNSKIVEESHTLPFRERGGGGQEGNESDRESKRRFPRMNFSRSTRACSSEDTLGWDGYRGKLDWDGGSNVARNPQ